jgi:predicted metal-binding membrane protein
VSAPAARVIREKAILAGTLFCVITLSWLYLTWMAADMAAVHGGASLAHCASMPGMTSSRAIYVWWLFVMWAAMAVAMMLPTALPMVAFYLRAHRGRHPELDATRPALTLALGYVLVWAGFGLVAALVQWGLEHAGQATPIMGTLTSRGVAGGMLVGAGVFQLTPLKSMCLSKCRTPLLFLMTRWRSGNAGALGMGVEHGLHCLGCCWALMLVMFVVGVMNLAWMGALAVLMLAEKVLPRGELLARLTGVASIAVGLWMFAVG